MNSTYIIVLIFIFQHQSELKILLITILIDYTHYYEDTFSYRMQDQFRCHVYFPLHIDQLLFEYFIFCIYFVLCFLIFLLHTLEMSSGLYGYNANDNSSNENESDHEQSNEVKPEEGSRKSNRERKSIINLELFDMELIEVADDFISVPSKHPTEVVTTSSSTSLTNPNSVTPKGRPRNESVDGTTKTKWETYRNNMKRFVATLARELHYLKGYQSRSTIHDSK